MKTTSTSTELLMIGTLLAPFIYLAIIWNQLPAQIITHYDFAGNPNDSMPKETAAVVMGAVSLVLYLTLRFLPSIDPKGRLQTTNYEKLRFVVVLAFASIVGWIWYTAQHNVAQQSVLIPLFAILGIMLAGIGNYITTVKPNWFVGIRTPWTLDSETVWRKTHRMAGRLMVVGGLLSAVLALVVPMPYGLWVIMGIILLVSFIPVVYSYIYYRQEKKHQLN
ncbi:SdpI family protein [Spirosoma aerolatum]|uniref:SdpI family protein n=1 Tax=Spirosoma aerolatum TaxID=1211326 RepID=UPI0009AD0644|nr:SdpI family protein [Spirosoma aerolatum]